MCAAEARSRIEALQARIRPHFLFNSLNTIAALTRSDPPRAEEAVEDLADLFRATLRDSHSPLRLKEELELTRIYQRIEELRLGRAAARCDWDVGELPMRAFVPGPHGAAVARERDLSRHRAARRRRYRDRLRARRGGNRIEIIGPNPVAAARNANGRQGNRLALENIRQRLRLAYGDDGALEVERQPGEIPRHDPLPIRRMSAGAAERSDRRRRAAGS